MVSGYFGPSPWSIDPGFHFRMLFAPQRVAALRLQRLLDDQAGGKAHQFGAGVRRRQAAFNQFQKGLACAHRSGCSLRHRVCSPVEASELPAVDCQLNGSMPRLIYPAHLGLDRST